MKKVLLIGLAIFGITQIHYSQIDLENPLPNQHTEWERGIEQDLRGSERGSAITTPPDFDVRSAAEWEEIQTLVITWAGYSAILKQITFHARQECEVMIICDNENEVMNYLESINSGGPAFLDLDNITFVEEDFNSVWIRDYGQHTIYENEVGQLHLVDWIYNRNRPQDNTVPERVALEKGLNLYATTEEPYDLMATGGNWMSDGMGTAFSSELIQEENEGGFAWGSTFYPDQTFEEIEDILNQFMGIDRYITMETLPYDIIHHIDMHMKLLDEETLIVGEYPEGVADGPQINANLDYVLSNYNSYFGDPYDVIRIEMPPEGGNYPDGSWPNQGDYRTYANMVFVNKTILVPVYEPEYDEPALAIIEEAMPGYNVVGINCNQIIGASGALHCITKAIGTDDPMLIVHQPLDDTDDNVNPYVVDGMIKHDSGIETGVLTYRVNGGDWMTAGMSEFDAETSMWTANIPAQAFGSVVDYYIQGNSNSGKSLTRPLVAPEGYWTFEVVSELVTVEENFVSLENPIQDIYPNPANAITVIPTNMPVGTNAQISIIDMTGRHVQDIYAGFIAAGEQKFFFDASSLAIGAYLVHMQIGEQVFTRKLMVK